MLKRIAALLKTAILQYTQEAVYYIRAKRTYWTERFPQDNPALILRKRTHHLERVLFSPESYSEDFIEMAIDDINFVLNNYSGLPPAQEKWARKVLAEYWASQREGRQSPWCPSLREGVERKPSPVTTEALMHLIRQRRSRRSFQDIPLTPEERQIICDAAQWAPSSCNRQTISLIFVEDRELKEFLAATIPGGAQFFHGAPSIVIVVADARDYRYPEERTNPFIDAALGVQNIYLVCETMGLGCCMGSYASFGSVLNEKEVRQKFQIPESHLIVASLAIGRSSQFVCDIPREDAAKRFWINYYGRK